MSRKAQFSFDLMVVVGVMLLLFLGLFQFYASKSETVQLIREKAEAKTITENFAMKINTALSTGDGSSTNFALPKTLDNGVQYNISASNRRVEIIMGSSTISSPISTSDVSSIDLNSRKGSQVQIANLMGKILIQ